MESISSAARARSLVSWAILAGCLIAWTVGLLTPYPRQVQQAGFSETQIFTLSKTVHVLAYAGLTVLSSWLGILERHRLPVIILLSFHGALTELLQNAVPTRTGTVRDALLDTTGVLLGLALLRLSRRRTTLARNFDAAEDFSAPDVYPIPERQPTARSA